MFTCKETFLTVWKLNTRVYAEISIVANLGVLTYGGGSLHSQINVPVEEAWTLLEVFPLLYSMIQAAFWKWILCASAR